jgi:hypothetical protein
VVLASAADVGQLKGFAVPRGLRSLLRRRRSFWGCRRTAPSFVSVAVAVLFVPATSWAQPAPDPPPPGLHGSQPTRLAPDGPPARRSSVPPAPPAPIAEATPTPVAETVATPPVEDMAGSTTEPRSARTAPAPPKRASRRIAPPAGRRFALTDKPARWAPRASPTIQGLSSDPDSRPYLVAALSLAVLALGSGTLVTVLSRLRSTRQGLA